MSDISQLLARGGGQKRSPPLHYLAQGEGRGGGGGVAIPPGRADVTRMEGADKVKEGVGVDLHHRGR
jgi:hypothetical protein